LIGEVSTCNDDEGDNIFAEDMPRFASIDEDCEIALPLAQDVAKLFAAASQQQQKQ
jgi:D-lyxose ketol-isomerase